MSGGKRRLPEIRFKEFSGEWVEKILGELGSTRKRISPFQSKYLRKRPTEVIVLTPGSGKI